MIVQILINNSSDIFIKFKSFEIFRDFLGINVSKKAYDRPLVIQSILLGYDSQCKGCKEARQNGGTPPPLLFLLSR